MDFPENERVALINELSSTIPVLSEYSRKLDDHARRRYLEKIAEVGVDPVTIPDEQFKSDCLLPIDLIKSICYPNLFKVNTR